MRNAVRWLRRLLRPLPPPADLEERLLRRLRSETPELSVAVTSLGDVIRRAVQDTAFRGALLADPERACRNAGFLLGAQEIAALRDLAENHAGAFDGELDERISKQM